MKGAEIKGQASEVTKRVTVLLLALCSLLGPFSFGSLASVQQRAGAARIAFLTTVPLSTIADRIGAFRQGLRELGHIEGENIVIEWRSAEGKEERLPALAAELVRMNMEVIVSAGSPVTRALQKATVTIPIVMALDPDPVGNKFVVNLARPGGNITGVSLLSPEITGKQLELLKETFPKLSRVAVLGTSTRPGNSQALTEIEIAAAKFGVRLQYFDVRGAEDIEAAFRAAMKTRADALVVLTGPQLNARRKQIIAAAAKSRLPAIYERAEFMKEGGLMVYGASIAELSRRAAYYVDKILKGAKPGELPVEQPTKFELMINLKTAKQIGLTIPPNVLARADRVIK